MKQLLTFSLLTLLTVVAVAQPDPNKPFVPTRLDVAGISVRLDEAARIIVQQDANALVSNPQFWRLKLDRIALYFPVMEAILIDEDIPTDFKYLAVQESSLVPDAVSTSQAVGFWQFKRETATDYGLRVDDAVDERKSITASTHAAARYLKRSNGQFNNWISSLYSFYLGATGITQRIPTDWAYAREITLDGNTDRYVLRFIAHKIAVETALPTYQATNTFALLEYPNGRGKTLAAVAGEIGADENAIRQLNRWLLTEPVPADKDYVLLVPVAANQINDVRQRIVGSGNTRNVPDAVLNDVGFPVLNKITAGVRSKDDPILYEINGLPGIQAQAGDDAGSLAKKARISYSSFLRYNDMTDRDPVVAGEVYYLAKKRKKALVPYHTVRDEETIRSISQRYGLRVKKLMRYNRLDRVQKLQLGRVMWLRERRPKNKPVEVINSPTPPVYDQTTPGYSNPAVPSNTPIVTKTQSGDPDSVPVSEPGGIPTRNTTVPRNASERVLYEPKFGTTDNTATTAPATRPATVPRPTATAPAPSATRPGITPRPTSAPPRPAAPGSIDPAATAPDESMNNDAPNRVVIVRPAGSPNSAGRNGYEVLGEDPAGNVSARPATAPATTSRPATIPTATTRPATTPASTAPVVTTRPTTTPAASYPAPATTTTRPPTTPAASYPAPAPVATTTRPATAPATTGSTKGRTLTHTVEAGQTYYSISKRYGVTIDELLAANGLTLNDKLSVGQPVTVKNVPSGFPVGESVIPATTTGRTAISSGTAPKTVFHTVLKGETMFRVSKIYNVTIEQIQEWNRLTGTAVNEGQRIKIVQ